MAVRYSNMCLMLDFWEASNFPESVSFDKFKLQRVNERLVEDIIAVLGTKLNDQELERWRNARYLLIHKYGNVSPRPDETKEDIRNFHKFVQFLRTLRNTTATGAAISLRENGSNITANYYRAHPERVFTRNLTVDEASFTKADSRNFRKYYLIYDKASLEAGYHRLANAFYFFEMFFHEAQARNRLISAVSALESLFNTESGETAYKVCSRCASFLENNPGHRYQIFTNLSEIYKLRSKIVHGQSLGKSIYNNPNEAAKLIDSAEDYMRDCLRLIYRKGYAGIFSKPGEILSKQFDEFVISGRKNLT
jgi:hypothetical protein